jgi:hypothetical protein
MISPQVEKDSNNKGTAPAVIFPLRIYVAGSWKDRVHLRETYMQPLRALGYEITHDWTRVEIGDVDSRLAKVNRQLAAQDIDGVKKADVVVVIIENLKYAYRGTCCEIGCALGLGKPVLLYHPLRKSYMQSNLFIYHEGVECLERWEDVLARLHGIAAATATATPTTAAAITVVEEPKGNGNSEKISE